jgi:nitrate reductase gamma subunit
MTMAVYAAICAGVLVFMAACATRAVMYAKQPPHLRWELYPVPHEPAGRARYGGSRYEETDWWTRARRRNLAGEVRFMLPELLFLKGLRDANRALWYRSFPFHFGLYLLGGAALLVVATAIVTIGVPAGAGGTLEATSRGLYRTAGLAGGALAVGGALGLLHRRLTDRALRRYSAPADYFNLASFVVTLVVLGAGYATSGPGFTGVLGLTRALLRFDTSVHVPALLGTGLILASALVAYIPLTHMSHFIAKYFTYHAVRWDDRPAADTRAMARRIAACLATRPSWSAPHVGADGTRTWVEIALENPTEGARS